MWMRLNCQAQYQKDKSLNKQCPVSPGGNGVMSGIARSSSSPAYRNALRIAKDHGKVSFSNCLKSSV
jgi:hypothetical protein